MNQIIPIPHAKISHNRIIMYTELFGRTYKNCGNKNSLNNLEDNRVKGILSPGSIKNIKKNIQIWTDCINAKMIVSRLNNDWLSNQITFCTLTLCAAQKHTDKEIKRDMLNRFFVNLKRDVNYKTNLWVAEKQDNGNIHFHILFEKYIYWKLIRKNWNKIQNDTGYISDYRNNQNTIHKNGFTLRTDKIKTWPEKKQYEAYQYGVKTNWTDPNSTDIHKLNKIKNITAYITKYLTKGNNQKKIEGSLWSCTNNFKELKSCDFIIDGFLDTYIEHEKNNINTKKYTGDNYSIISDTSIINLKNKSPSYYKKYMEIQNHNYNLLYKI